MDATIKVIKTEQDHALAVEHLLSLMAADGDQHTETIELLALVIQAYEHKVSPRPSVDPVNAILFRMEQMGMAAEDLIPYLGSQSKVSEVLNRQRPLTLAMMRRLHKGLGMPAEMLLGEEDGLPDLAAEPELDASKCP